MDLITITDTVNDLFYNNSSSYNTIASIQRELLAILGASTDIFSLCNYPIQFCITITNNKYKSLYNVISI